MKGKATARSLLENLQSTGTTGRLYEKLVIPHLTKPYQSPTMEVTRGAWNGTAAARDRSGRQLGEDNVTPLRFRSNTPIEWKTWKANDSRKGRPFNLPALRQITDHWQEVLRLTAAVRHRFLRLHHNRGPVLTPSDLFVVALILTSIPSYLLRRSRCPLEDGQIPEAVAAAYKAAAGVHYAVRNLLAETHRSCTTDEILQPEQLLAYIEDNDLLVSPSGKVCSGPRTLIAQFFSALVEGNEEFEPPISLSEQELEECLSYGLINAQLEFDTMLHCLTVARSALQHREEAERPLRDALNDVLVNYCPRHDPRLSEPGARFSLLKECLDRYWPDRKIDFELHWATSDNEPRERLKQIEQKALQLFKKRQKMIDNALGRGPCTKLTPVDIRHRFVGRYLDLCGDLA